MNFSRVLEHCIKNKFISQDLCQFSFLGDALQERIRSEWLSSSVVQSPKAMFINSDPVSQPNAQLVDYFVKAQALMGSDGSISLAGFSCSRSDGNRPVKEVSDIPELMKSLPATYLNLCTLVHPSLKLDEFHSFQKTRRLWWKSYMQQPVLLNMTSIPIDNTSEPLVEQKIEFGSSTLESGPFEVLQLLKPQLFDSLQLDDEVKKSLTVKFQRKSTWPYLITSQVRLELAVWFFLADAFYTRNKTSVLSLHRFLAPYPVGIIIEGTPTKAEELGDLRRLLSLDFKQSNIPVLPLSTPWTAAQCDARGIPYLICLSDTTLEQGVCGLRSRDTTLQEEVHVGVVVERLKKFLIR